MQMKVYINRTPTNLFHIFLYYTAIPVVLGLLLAWGKVGFPALKQVSPKTLAYSTSTS